jgi:cytochrome c biogenesis protein CcmG/thiol:disulfide interchange protein DsbE
MTKRFIMSAIAVIVILAAIGFMAMQPDRISEKEPGMQPAEAGVTAGKILTGFTLGGLDGKMVTVAPAGRIIVLNFWATWCPPCREEMPELEKFSQKYNGKVLFYAVNIQESSEKVAAFLTQNQYTLPVLLDKDGEVARSFRINAIPTSIVVDKHGVIKYRKSGPVTLAELEGVLNGL